MKDEITSGAIWNEAAKAGLIFGGISLSYVGLSELISKVPGAVLQGVLMTILWAVKFAGCIYLMYCLMKALTKEYSAVGNAHIIPYSPKK